MLPYAENLNYIEGLYEAYLRDPKSLSKEWQDYFETFPKAPGNVPGAAQAKDIQDSIHALMMIRNYRVRGHLHATLDPLGLEKRPPHDELDPSFYGFSGEDFARPIYLDGVLGFQSATLKQVLSRLLRTYCSTIGIEFMHIQDPVKKSWIQEVVETTPFVLTSQQKHVIFKDLMRAEVFEKFLHTKFPGAKRFGLDGGESLIPALAHIFHQSGEKGVEDIVIGMAHRGRLNVSTNLLKKPFRTLFAQFLNQQDDPYAIGSGDVKYHVGYTSDLEMDGHKLHISLMSNPSHLESINPVVLGKVRAEQHITKDTHRKRVMGLLIHGDAAFCGQGLVAETFELCDLNGYRTGGTLHFIINNQIGFTTSPPHSRSSPYSSDVAKVIQAPIFHVNGDDPEAVIRVCQWATHYREQFKSDVVIDLVCYRKFGHNESDEPSFTQPLMYKAISTHLSAVDIYAKKLLGKGVLEMDEISKMRSELQAIFEEEYKKAAADDNCFDPPQPLSRGWEGLESGPSDEFAFLPDPPTGWDKDALYRVASPLFQIPEGIKVNQKIIRQLEAKQKMLETGKGFDWSTAEALAFGTLLVEGHHVRLSGQDCGRGTFSSRHAVLVDQENEKKYIPLNHLSPDQASVEIIDSPLAEASVLGFEYGYSGADPNNLVMWEAQFGDFANGAQVVIDQFLASGETKWGRQNGLVMLLPHGYEGQGPDHSSARLERFLQLCAEGNWTVANCSTPANYFHILRRQVKRNYRKPLVLMTPKSLLRHPLCVSNLEDFEGTFTPVFRSTQQPKQVKRVLLCSGKVYYDLLHALESSKANYIASIRIEQFYPWPEDALKEALKPYKNAEFVWFQEEPENMGAWQFVDRRLEKTLQGISAPFSRPTLIARKPSASPATGLYNRHEQEQKELIERALAKPKHQPLTASK